MRSIRLERRLLISCAGAALLTVCALCLLLGGQKEAAPVFAEGRAGYVPVIDAGHGGDDGGAVSVTGAYESEINLDISLKLQQIFALFGMNSVMTRTSDQIDYPAEAATVRQRKVADQRARVALVNQTERAFLLSIHQNHYASGGPFGAQSLYAPDAVSREFALYLQENLVQNLNPENYRPAAQISSEIYLMNSVKCPAVLVECGFLSNASEDALLQTDAYRLKTAAVIAGSFIGFNRPAS